MKAIGIDQPYATLIAIGAKRFETRGYPPGRLGLYVGQRIAIHATRSGRSLYLCYQPEFERALKRHGQQLLSDLPRGAVVAYATIEDAWEIRSPNVVPRPERDFGDWLPGRWAWKLSNVSRVTPIPTRGRQGAFDVQDEMIVRPATTGGG